MDDKHMVRRRIRGQSKTMLAALRAITESAYIEITPLPNDWYEVAVKIDRANVLHPTEALKK